MVYKEGAFFHESIKYFYKIGVNITFKTIFFSVHLTQTPR